MRIGRYPTLAHKIRPDLEIVLTTIRGLVENELKTVEQLIGSPGKHVFVD